MASDGLHAPRERLSAATLAMHHAIVSLMEELEAVDWYRQRADDCEDDELKAILIHNMEEEMEHTAMVLEWIRRNNEAFAGELDEYLHRDGPIVTGGDWPVSTAEPDVLERPAVEDLPQETDPDEPDRAHIGRKEDVSRAYVTGEAITALCGTVFVPSRDPSRYPVCEACKDVLDRIRAGRTGQN